MRSTRPAARLLAPVLTLLALTACVPETPGALPGNDASAAPTAGTPTPTDVDPPTTTTSATEPSDAPSTSPTSTPSGTSAPSAPLETSPSSSLPFDTVTSDDGYIDTGEFASQIWKSDEFQGSFTRSIRGDHEDYLVTLEQSAGGFDTGIDRHLPPVTRVDEVDPARTVSARIDVRVQTQGDGQWWAGPKVTVHALPEFRGFEGDYENYIVENASLPPDAFAERMFRGSTYLGETQQDGATYKHYLSQHPGGWEQYWAVRQTYRTDGTVSLVPHLQTWRENGMANDFVVLQKPANFETYGAVSGEVEFTAPTYAP